MDHRPLRDVYEDVVTQRVEALAADEDPTLGRVGASWRADLLHDALHPVANVATEAAFRWGPLEAPSFEALDAAHIQGVSSWAAPRFHRLSPRQPDAPRYAPVNPRRVLAALPDTAQARRLTVATLECYPTEGCYTLRLHRDTRKYPPPDEDDAADPAEGEDWGEGDRWVLEGEDVWFLEADPHPNALAPWGEDAQDERRRGWCRVPTSAWRTVLDAANALDASTLEVLLCLDHVEARIGPPNIPGWTHERDYAGIMHIPAQDVAGSAEATYSVEYLHDVWNDVSRMGASLLEWADGEPLRVVRGHGTWTDPDMGLCIATTAPRK